ncbi:N-6 DNA methylase [Bifidobacterium animalis]|uniref:site-specific DNA-methyltransferase (adenine-specific) n=1 Tax=Bifidobacterium animalis subsp. lactis TaxID=302911 RepID=A0A8B3REH8_BIFAN|nr:N-6 DNA methylase [Bifidobacterium animalis]RYM91880.1 restriction enzyme BcgI alpha chain-like protein [Bifidobacterium animalis subsp. lactis]
MAKVQSVEPNIAHLANGWMQQYELDYKLEQESLNEEIDKALSEYASKQGGAGGNRPDAKLLLQDSNQDWFPILIEYKGYKDKLVKLTKNGHVANRDAKNNPNYNNIKSYAVNGAVHYANAILHYTSYTDVIAIGITGYKDAYGDLRHSIGVYYVSKSNLGVGQKVGEFSDLSFLGKDNFDEFIKQVRELSLTPEELDHIRKEKDREIRASLVRLNNDVYKDEKGLGERDRVYLVAATIMATLGIPGEVKPLEKNDLKSSTETGEWDGDILLRKINAFLDKKHLPDKKKAMIVRTLQNTLTTENLNKVVNGETQLKRVFSRVVDDLGIYYKIGLTTDFTGKLFNEMYSWLGFTQDKLNDVVLTPSYVAKLLVKLARINQNSYVWDFATGSAGLLVAAMNEMLDDAKRRSTSPYELEQKTLKIKAEQLLGLEVLQDVYMLAILNMIMMGDGSSNILNMDSLEEFDGKYGYGRENKVFPATAFILNPPYSAEGNGMVFVEKALSMMQGGYGAIIIQSSAGSGKAIEYNQRILQHSTLLASIKMPSDLFAGKSNVQTCVYVFKVGEPHEKDSIVKFIDFSNDGYSRNTRKKAVSNLENVDHADQRYQEIVDLVKFGKSKLHYLDETNYYEGTIDPQNGADWNQIAPVDVQPTFTDYTNSVKDQLIWKLSTLLDEVVGDEESAMNQSIGNLIEKADWKDFKLGDLFTIESTKSFNKNALTSGDNYDYITRTSRQQGILKTTGFVNNENLNESGIWSLGLMQMTFFYRERQWYAGQFVKKVVPIIDIPVDCAPFFTTLLNKQHDRLQPVLVRNVPATFAEGIVKIPVTADGDIDFDCIRLLVSMLEKRETAKLISYLKSLF